MNLGTNRFESNFGKMRTNKFKNQSKNYEENKYDSFDTYRKQNSRVLSTQDIHEEGKGYKRRGTLEGREINKSLRAIPKKMKLKKASTLVDLAIKKLENPRSVRSRRTEIDHPRIPSRKLTLNDIHIFIFLIILT